MRAKFVPAEMLYPSTNPTSQQDSNQAPQSTYGTVDYNAFSQPPTTVGEVAFASQEPAPETPQKEASDYGSDFQIPVFDPTQLIDDHENEPFFNSFSYKANEPEAKQSKSIPSSSTKGSPPDSGAYNKVSKFGFGYEALSESIDELELTSSSKELIEKFSQAKYQIEMGNIEEGNKILNEMMESKQIRYKQYANLENHIMSTFAPISE